MAIIIDPIRRAESVEIPPRPLRGFSTNQTQRAFSEAAAWMGWMGCSVAVKML
jgi:hypothetical protein